jgi:hypothetical protein
MIAEQAVEGALMALTGVAIAAALAAQGATLVQHTCSRRSTGSRLLSAVVRSR